MHCFMHNVFYSGKECEKCLAGEEPYLYTRDEVADPDEWRLLKMRGWVK